MLVSGAALLLHVLPGYAVQSLLPRRAALKTAEQFALALGIGIALPPLLLEISTWFGLRWRAGVLVVYLAVCALILAARWLRQPGRQPGWPRISVRHALQTSRQTPLPILLVLSGLGLAVRLYVVRDVPVGLWGDSVHHTMIAQLLADHGGVFTSWMPYAALGTFTYHFGFQANAAFLHWLTGLPVPQCVVLMGQWLNACSIPMAYLITARITRSPAAGLWAAVLTGFVNAHPAYYVNWGRYTQLAGQIILPALLVVWAEAISPGKRRWPSRWPWMMLAAVLMASLMLTHYIVTIFASLFLFVLILSRVVGFIVTAWTRHNRLRPALWRVAVSVVASAVISLGALALAGRWVLNTLSGYLAQNVSEFVTGEVGAARIIEYSALNWPGPFFLNNAIVALAVVGFVASIAAVLMRRRANALLFAAWTGCILIAIVPNVVGLPGRGVIDFQTGFITLYVTVAPLAGFGIASLQRVAQRWARRSTLPVKWVQRSGLLALLLVAGWGIGWQKDILDVRNQLVRPADLRAMEWIRANTKTDARFLVNAFPAYGGTLIAGKDGGWWIPLLAGRQTNLPPITYGSEQGLTSNYRREINDFAARLRGKPLTDGAPVQIDLTTPAARAQLRAAGITYIYQGAYQSPGSNVDEIDVTTLRGDAHFKAVYAEGGVEIFELLPD